MEANNLPDLSLSTYHWQPFDFYADLPTIKISEVNLTNNQPVEEMIANKSRTRWKAEGEDENDRAEPEDERAHNDDAQDPYEKVILKPQSIRTFIIEY